MVNQLTREKRASNNMWICEAYLIQINSVVKTRECFAASSSTILLSNTFAKGFALQLSSLLLQNKLIIHFLVSFALRFKLLNHFVSETSSQERILTLHIKFCFVKYRKKREKIINII
jgi:hypothetical protein